MHGRCLCIFVYVHITCKSVLKLMYVIYVHTYISVSMRNICTYRKIVNTHTNISLAAEISLQIV